ncbi:hypothetical protein RDI58_009799 [Solanum bulbocastanum]|uniref:Uncharacterized protein n=1 Tax=Solanum bulbocastanum TaxID=147425 RepID=A0AAN8TTY8_SOLBU
MDGKDKISKQVIETKSITWKVVGRDMLELYNFFTAIISLVEEVPEPLVLLGFIIDLTRDIEGHLLN